VDCISLVEASAFSANLLLASMLRYSNTPFN
jgi:hypothetical protein